MDKDEYQGLVINIGSTSVKLGSFSGSDFRFREKIEYSREETDQLRTYDEWRDYLRAALEKTLKAWDDYLGRPDLVVSRGGLTRPLEGGAYRINQAMIEDLRSGAYGWHPTNIGPALAREIAAAHGAEAIIYDSPVVDEMSALARFSGLKGIQRKAAFHVLNQKSAARKGAARLEIPYEESRFIVAHMGGGITVGAHREGKIIDGTHGLSEGPFTPQRTGVLPNLEVIDLCFSGHYSKEELTATLVSRGGLLSYLGEYDMEKLERAVSAGDEEALLSVKAMAYQIGKEICAMAAVLEGRVDGVILTGNLCHVSLVVEELRKRISFLGKLLVYPGEDELENLALGASAVMSGKEKIREY